MSNIIKERVLINNAYLKAYSPIPDNFNMDEISNYVKISELIWVKNIIGDALYAELLNEVEDEDISEVNSTLLLKIYPLLSFAVVYEALPFIWADISEVGITLGHSDNSDSIKLNDLDYVLKHLKAQLQVRSDELKSFLKRHKGLYPLYEDENECCNVKKDNPFIQLYTTKKKNKEIK